MAEASKEPKTTAKETKATNRKPRPPKSIIGRSVKLNITELTNYSGAQFVGTGVRLSIEKKLWDASGRPTSVTISVNE